MSYDGITEWEAEKLDDILELFSSEELIKVILLLLPIRLGG
jgi:hypothetical protein